MNHRPGHHPDEQLRHDPAQPAFVYHRFFKTFSGDSPDDVVRAIHQDAQQTTRQDFSAWWAEQTHLWRHKHNLTVPAASEPHAAQTLLDILVKTGMLNIGPQPLCPRPRRAQFNIFLKEHRYDRP